MTSELYLDITPNSSTKSFRIKDASIYNENLPITCGQLLVKIPGFYQTHTFEPLPKFDFLVNMGNLGISTHGALSPLPDGNYEIKYSINPNELIFVEYNYYSTAQLYKEYIQAACDYLNKDVTSKTIDKLFEVSNLLEYAKIAAEECQDECIANKMYKQAQAKLKELKSECM